MSGGCVLSGGSLYREVSVLGHPPGHRPPAPPLDRQTPVKILPCPKLRLWVVINHSQQLSQCYKVYLEQAPADNEKVRSQALKLFIRC